MFADLFLRRCLAATVLLMGLFIVWPRFDIAFSQIFITADGQFVLADVALAETLRQLFWKSSEVVVIGALIMFALHVMRGGQAQTPRRIWAYVLWVYALGPCLLANVLLKSYWGRARPASIREFGGSQLYTPPYEIADQCARNCSFVSGEAASTATMCIALAVCFGTSLPPAWHRVSVAALVMCFVTASALRVASGRHFLSDVVFAGLFMLIIARILFLKLDLRGKVPSNLASLMLADVRGGTYAPRPRAP